MIRVFNSRPVGPLKPHEILAAITESNYQTLWQAVWIGSGIDCAWPGTFGGSGGAGCGSNRSSPWSIARDGEASDRGFFSRLGFKTRSRWKADRRQRPCRRHSWSTVQLVSIELAEDQLQDLGLLLAYELARWAAVQGRGVIQALDGRWYRLNAHKAFLPVEDLG